MDRNKANAFVKHIKECHEGQNGTLFQMDIIKTFKKPLERQTREGIEIFRANADIVLNSKLDHFQPGLRRITFGDILDDI